MKTKVKNNDFLTGLKAAFPIGLAYLAVSFAIGVSASSMGLKGFVAVLMSMTNMTSAGQQAGILIIVAMGTIVEVIVTQLVINARYFLMSLSLSQRLDPTMTLLDRCLVAFGVTDEIFAVAVTKNKGVIKKGFLLGAEFMAWFSWSFGTLLGVIVGDVLPSFLINALAIAIYAMFISIVFSGVFNDPKILPAIVLSAGLSCMIYFVPAFESLRAISCVICGVIASVVGALIFPVKDEQEVEEKSKAQDPVAIPTKQPARAFVGFRPVRVRGGHRGK